MDRTQPQWLSWARRIQAISQNGLAYSTNQYDIERFHQLAELAAEIVEQHTALPAAELTSDFVSQIGYATPKADVRGAVVVDGQILLVQERVDGRWCLPGGWADVGEGPSEMVVREVQEESGLTVVPRKLIGIYDANRAEGRISFSHAYKIIFLCDHISGTPQPSAETLDAAFFSFDELPPLSTNRTDRHHLAEVQAHLADPTRPAWFD